MDEGKLQNNCYKITYKDILEDDPNNKRVNICLNNKGFTWQE